MLAFPTKICYTVYVGEEKDLKNSASKKARLAAQTVAWEVKKEATIVVKYGPRKIGAFADFRLKRLLLERVAAEKKSILKSRYHYLLSIMEVTEPQILWNELENYLKLSNEICCKVKPSFTLEEAAVAKQASNPDLEPYICRSCGFVHFGHEPKPLKLILARIAA